MERINAYCTPGENGATIVDVEGMAVDLVSICKGYGFSREQFLINMGSTWDEVQVEITIPNEAKN